MIPIFTFKFTSNILNLEFHKIFGHLVAVKNSNVLYLGWISRRSYICIVIIQLLQAEADLRIRKLS